MKDAVMHLCRFLLILVLLTAAACTAPYRAPDLGGLYNRLAQNESPDRNPVILIPGLLGSKLVSRTSGELAWGAFGMGRHPSTSSEGLRQIALPMAPGQPLKALRDDLMAQGALDRVVINLWGYPLELSTYGHILGTLGVGGYRDQQLAESGAIDYGDRHFTCFQFDYDWRRDIVENARALGRFIAEKRGYVQNEIRKRFGLENHEVKFDIVAHSMGGLIARYYLRYGSADLPADGRLPEITWAGSRHVENVVMIGVPNAGSVKALSSLIEGHRPAQLLPFYPPALLGTMPSMYQLLPRSRHRPLLNTDGKPVDDILAPELWETNRWGLADPGQDRILQQLLPGIDDAAQRRAVGLDHLRKSLERARRFAAAMDVPAVPPAAVNYILFAGDAAPTARTLQITREGQLTLVEQGPGDSIVLRSSALMDERRSGQTERRLISPIRWRQVVFVFSEHLDITRNPAFSDNLLFFLLESQKES